MGHVIKVSIMFSEFFWKDKGFSGFFHSQNGPIRVGYEFSNEQCGLVGFVCANKAKLFGDKSLEERKNLIIDQISKLFNISIKKLKEICIGYVDHNWAEVNIEINKGRIHQRILWIF